MIPLNEIKQILVSATIALGEQAGSQGNPPWQGFGGINWTQQMIEMLGQTIMNTEQLGPWYQNPGQGNVQPGWTIAQDADGGIGSGNIQSAFWADAWNYPVPLSQEHTELYNSQMGGENSVYWIGITAIMYAMRYATPLPQGCDFTCVMTQIYAHFLRGPAGMDSKRWGKLADTGLENFLNNWNALVQVLFPNIEAEEEKPAEEDNVTVKPGDTLYGISNGQVQPWLDANPGIGDGSLIYPGQVLAIPKG